MGGSSYVNVMYQILESTELAYTEKELALTITTIFNDIGILTASITALVLTNTVFKMWYLNMIKWIFNIYFKAIIINFTIILIY